MGSHNSDKLLSRTLFRPKKPVLASFSAKNGKKRGIWGILSQYVKVLERKHFLPVKQKKDGFRAKISAVWIQNKNYYKAIRVLTGGVFIKMHIFLPCEKVLAANDIFYSSMVSYLFVAVTWFAKKDKLSI